MKPTPQNHAADQPQTQRHKTELAQLKADIRDAKRYLRKQGQIVEEMTATWAAAIGEFRDENDRIVEEKKTLLADKIRIQQEITAMQRDASKLEEKIAALDELFRVKASSYRDQLAALKSALHQ